MSVILFMGPTACGKSSLLNLLCDRYKQVNPIVRVTTRTKRSGEIDGKDYIFISKREFDYLRSKDSFLEYEEFSNDRFYGTLKKSFKSDESLLCSTITPSGLVQLCNSQEDFGKIFLVYCTCSLGTQIVRYVSRTVGFDVTDKMEMCDRLARDEGMFKGISSIINLVENSYGPDRFKTICVDTEAEKDACVDYIVREMEEFLGESLN